MVKERKLTKSSIAIIVLALLLVASLIMGMTGAWFTDSKTTGELTDTLTFGTVKLNYAGPDGSTAAFTEVNLPISNVELMLPGHNVTVEGAVIDHENTVKSLMSKVVGEFTVTITKTGDATYGSGVAFTFNDAQHDIFDYFDVYARAAGDTGDYTKIEAADEATFKWYTLNDTVFADGKKVNYLDNGAWAKRTGDAVEGDLIGDAYIVDAISSTNVELFRSKDIKLVVKTSVVNHEEGALYIPNGATMEINYNVTIKAIQADYITTADAALALGLTQTPANG